MDVSSKWMWPCVPIAQCLCCVALAASGAVGPFQQHEQPPPPIFRAEHNEVEVVVIVRDREGRPVDNLTQTDFEIRDNGKLQTITSFTTQAATRRPIPTQAADSVASTTSGSQVQRRFVALFFDDLHTEPGDFARVQKAAEQFVQESLQPEDRVAIFKTSENGDFTFTNDKQNLVSAIDALRAHPATNISNVRQCPRITNYEAYLIANHLDPEPLNIVAERLLNCTCPPPRTAGCPTVDDLKGAADGYARETWQFQRDASQNLLTALDRTVHVLGTMPGRRMLMLSSSGFLSGDLDQNVDRVIDNALRVGVVINALSAKGLYADTPSGKLSEQRLDGTFSVDPETSRYEARQFSARMEAEDEAMADFAESTGGKFFKSNNDFLRAFNELWAPQFAYALAFSPDPLKHDGKFHTLKVGLKVHGHFSLYTRKGYFASSGKEPETASVRTSSTPPVSPPKKAISAPGETKSPPTSTADTNAVPPNAKPTDTSAQPAGETKLETAKPVGSEPQLKIAEGVSVTPSSTSTPEKPASAPVVDEIASEQAFLKLASREVEHYVEAFVDLTADETRIMESFDEHGFAAQERSIRSELVIYRLRNDPKNVAEFREVISVDGHDVKGHAARAAKLWRELAGAHSPEEEIKRIKSDSERYDIGVEETGFTLFEGLPLRSRCVGDFSFREVRRETANGRPVRGFTYRQVRSCDVATYHFALPRQFADSPLLQAGELELDAETGQIVREERNIYVGNGGEKSNRVAHLALDYGESRFGILVPKRIVIETFLPGEAINRTGFDFRLHGRLVQTYGPFSRFEVSTGEKISVAAQ